MRRHVAKWFLLTLCWLSVAAMAASFDHDATRFPLEGFHRLVECEVCHVNGRFQGTPMQCDACHGGSSPIPAGGKSPHHLPTTNACGDCHRAQNWELVSRFDHAQARGACQQCHNGSVQPGKPANHVVSSEQCDSCHTTALWQMARFDHSGISGSCSACHNNVQASGKPRDHLNTTAECNQCHSTRAWAPARFDHSDVSGNCSGCHNGVDATGKNSGHFVTTRECNSCHNTVRWNSVNYVHQGSGYPGEHRDRLECRDCHRGNVEMNVWTYPAYQPDCAGCHANRYETGEHKKVDSPAIFYNVSELRDCSGACHEYTDSTFTTIRRARTGYHRVNSSSFGD